MQEYSSRRRLVTGLIFIIILGIVIGLAASMIRRIGVPKIDPNIYQSVILEGNQQYFGHLKNLNSRYPYLADVYYVRPGSNGASPQLIKLGGELHGPEDMMYLNWKKVVFWENLRPDSEVVKGIAKEKVQRTNPQLQQQSAPAPTAPAPASPPTGTATPAPAAAPRQ